VPSEPASLAEDDATLHAPAFFAAEEECLPWAESIRTELGDGVYRALVECTAAASDLSEGDACLLAAC